MPAKLGVLLVEDDRDDFVIFRDLLEDVAIQDYDLAWVPTASEALTEIGSAAPDVCVVDYLLGADNGIDVLTAAKRTHPYLPIVFLTGMGNPAIESLALRSGADDYLSKDSMSAALLERTLRYAFQRHLLLRYLHEADERDRRERELRTLVRIEAPAPAARLRVNVSPVQARYPKQFLELVQGYREILELALDQRQKHSAYNVPGELRALADSVGRLDGAGRDLIDIHLRAMRELSRVLRGEDLAHLAEEGRATLLETMSYLIAYYRSRVPAPTGPSNRPSRPRDTAG
jgi:CheY-like chemotaxis protein